MDAHIIEPVQNRDGVIDAVANLEIDKGELQEILETFFLQDESSQQMVLSIVELLKLPEEKFVLLAGEVLENYKLSLNDPDAKLMLVQSLNANGQKAEDLINVFVGFKDGVMKTNLSDTKKGFLIEMIGSLINSISSTEGIAKRIVTIPFELCSESAVLPEYAHISDSGMDVFALEDITIVPGETKLIPTGFKTALPPGYELQVRPKSGRALKTKLRIANTPGTIDQGYRDEIGIIVENIDAPIKDITLDDEGKVTSILYGSSYTIGKGEKFCQLVLSEVVKASPYEVPNILEVDSEDRGGGFGSTGLLKGLM